MTVQAMTAAQVFEHVLTKRELFILDVRHEDAYADWYISGSSITSVNIPYFDFLEGAEKHLGRLPQDQPILVVCAQEGASHFVAQELAEQGFYSYYLEGGMQSWSEYLHLTQVFADEQVEVYQIIRVGKGCLSYVLISGENMIVIDPLRFTSCYEEIAQDQHVQITHILDTHLHADHISGGRALAKKTGATYYLMQSEGAVFNFEALDNYQKISFAQVGLDLILLKTPGHTPGSVSFLINQQFLFSGDTLFISGLGRPDLGGKGGEWAADLYETLSGELANLADEIIILPGHYANYEQEVNEEGYLGERLGSIREHNIQMFSLKKDEFIRQIEQTASSVTPPNFEEVLAINRGLQEMDQGELRELEIGPNHCAILFEEKI